MIGYGTAVRCATASFVSDRIVRSRTTSRSGFIIYIYFIIHVEPRQQKLFFAIFSFLGCNKRLDLAFLIDGSGSINSAGRGNFRRCIEFVKSVVSSFNVSPRHTRVGVVLFSSRAWLILDFYRSRSKAGVLSTISRIRYPRGGTRIGKALNFVVYRLFRRSRRALKVRATWITSDSFSFLLSFYVMWSGKVLAIEWSWQCSCETKHWWVVHITKYLHV